MPVYWFLIMVTVANGIPSTTITPMPNNEVCMEVLKKTGALFKDLRVSAGPKAVCYPSTGATPRP